MPGHREGVPEMNHADHQRHPLVPVVRGVERQDQELRRGMPLPLLPVPSTAAPGSRPSLPPPAPVPREGSGRHRRRPTPAVPGVPSRSILALPGLLPPNLGRAVVCQERTFQPQGQTRRRQPWTEDRCRLSLWHRGYFAGVRRMTTGRKLGGGHGDLGQHMVRTGARPLQTERRPRYWPMSRFSGTTPTDAAISRPLRHSKSDSSEESMVAMTDSRQADCAATRYGIARPGLSAIGLGVPGSRPPVRPSSQSRVRHEAVMLT